MVLIFGWACASCSSGDDRELIVLAPSSLTEAVEEAGRVFESTHPGITVTASFASSASVAAQVRAGAPADVVATADETTMKELADHRLVDSPVDLARNSLALITPPDNPGRVAGVADLARTGVTVAVCDPQVPCGRLARTLFARAGIRVRPVSEEPNVKGVVTKVLTGEVDAGVVYRTDARAARARVHAVPVASSLNPSTTYRCALAADTRLPQEAKEFVAFLTSPGGRELLAERGFAPA